MFSSLLMNLVIFFVIIKKIAHPSAGWRNPFVKWLLFLCWDKWKRLGNEPPCISKTLSMLLNLPDTSKQESIWSMKSLMKNSSFGGENDFHPCNKIQFTEAVISLLPKDFYPSFNNLLKLHGKHAEHLTKTNPALIPPLKIQFMRGQKHPKNRFISPLFCRLKRSSYPSLIPAS